MPITNTIMLGAFAAVSGIVSAGAVEQAIRENMPEKLQVRNIAAVSAKGKCRVRKPSAVRDRKRTEGRSGATGGRQAQNPRTA